MSEATSTSRPAKEDIEIHDPRVEGVHIFNGVRQQSTEQRPNLTVGGVSTETICGAITHHASQSFTDAIFDELRAGYGFVPLIGAGFSVSAGIPIIHQLQFYLQRCICIALGVEDDRLAANDIRQFWNPRTDHWPPLIDPQRAEHRDWVGSMKKKLKDEKTRGAGLEPHSFERERCLANESIYQEALGAMAEWRSCLLLISRLIFDRPRLRTPDEKQGYADNPLLPRLGQPSQAVIDAGWREWLRDKRPSLNHKLLATLSSLLRIDVILTTNFDDLLEKAFEDSRNSLQVFDVRLVEGLPELETVLHRRSLVKMHGSTRSLRADYSLDGEPSIEDKNTFTDYLAGRRVDPEIHSITPPTRASKHLLVFGVGGSEQRTMAFVTHALHALPDLKVFWVCYNQQTVQGVINYARTIDPIDKAEIGRTTRLNVLRHTDVGLLLLHLVQNIRRTLPSAHAVYPSTTQLSVPPLPILNEQVGVLESFVVELERHLECSPLLVVLSANSIAGVTTACADLYRRLESLYVCMWIEMNDIYSVDELFETIQETAYSKLGQKDWTPIYAADDDRPRKLEIKSVADASNKPFLIFINAREKPGANRDFVDSEPNTWMDKEQAVVKINSLLADLRDARVGRFKVVLLCRGQDSGLVTGPHRFIGNKIILRKGVPDRTAATFAKLDTWLSCRERREKIIFLHALGLMQRSRHLSVTWSLAAGQPEEQYWDKSLDGVKPKWLAQLEMMGLIRRKDGGFIWMHSFQREALRKKLLGLREEGYDCKFRASVHERLSLWYLKLFDSTGVPACVFEAVDHLCMSAAHLLVGKNNKEDTSSALLEDARHRVDTALHFLEQHQFLIISQGYPRASSRRLQYVSDFWLRAQWMTGDATIPSILIKLRGQAPDAVKALERSIAKLQCVATQIDLMIAREIGEEKTAYSRMHILARRLGPFIPFTDEMLLKRGLDDADAQTTGSAHWRIVVERNINSSEPSRSRLDDWIRWWLWCGLLGIASRSFTEAERSLKRAVSALCRRTITFEDPNRSWAELASDPSLEFPGGSHLEVRGLYKAYLEGLYAIQEAAHLLILRANARFRLEALRGERFLTGEKQVAEEDSEPSLLRSAESLTIRGLLLIEQIQNSGADRPTDDDHRLASSKARLLQLAGLASRHDSDRVLHSRHAMSMMSDASAALNSSETLFASAEQAIVDLRRAEVRLREAAAFPVFECDFEKWTYDRLSGASIDGECDSNYLKVSQVAVVRDLKTAWLDDASRAAPARERLERIAIGIKRAQGELAGLITEEKELSIKNKAAQAALRRRLKGLKDSFAGEQLKRVPTSEWNLEQNLIQVEARARDALRYLDRAEPILRDRRRNVSWTTCYLELRLRAVSFVLWTSVVRVGSPIPYLGLEAAMRKSETEADRLLDDALRMIRVDSYRLAMVILTYASCARALQIRLALDPAAVRLPERLRSMGTRLEHASAQLKEVIIRRQSNSATEPPHNEEFARSEIGPTRKASIRRKQEMRTRGEGPKQEDLRKRSVNATVQAVVDAAVDRVQDVIYGLEPKQVAK